MSERRKTDPKLLANVGTGLGVGGMALLGYLGETKHLDGFIQDLWTMLKQASPPTACLLMILYIRETRERIYAQRECADRTIDFIKSTNLMSRAFDKALSRRKRGS